VDDARHGVDVARAQKAAAEAQQIASAPLGADSRVALGALMQAQAQLTGANVRLGQTRIGAVQDGTVLSRAVEPGDIVQPGRTLLVLAIDGEAQIVFQPDERNLAHMALGQKARASADAFPQDVFDGEVDYIAPSVDPQRGTVEVRLKVALPPKFLKPDMTISVDLTVAAKKDALVVPAETMHGLTSPKPWVLAVEGGRAVRKDVTLGIRGEGAVEVLAGVEVGAELIVPDGQAVLPGQRVRAVAKEP
jgi:HlyD family secretion protein